MSCDGMSHVLWWYVTCLVVVCRMSCGGMSCDGMSHVL